jgi:acyl carrier protein
MSRIHVPPPDAALGGGVFAARKLLPFTFMNQAEVIAQLQAIFDDIFLEPVVLTPEISAKDVPEWDSLTHISLMVAVEKSFGVRFRVGEVENARNVGEFANLILKRKLEP